MPVTIDPTAFYEESEAAEQLGISAGTMRRRRQTSSELAFCKYGRRVFYKGEDLIATLEASRRRSTSEARP